MSNNTKTRSMGKKKSKNQIERSRAGLGSTPSFPKTARLTMDRKVAEYSAKGVELRNSYFRFDGRAQVLTDYSGMGDSARVCGVDLFGTAVTAGSSIAAAGFGGTSSYAAFCTPATISPRLSALESLFQFYAIRKLRVTYIPTVGTSTAGSVAIGLAQDANVNGTTATLDTQREVLELTPSMLTPVWNSDSATYTHSGTKVWATSSQNSAPTNDYIQGIFYAVLLGATASVNYGQLRLEFVIDFYKPSPILPSPSIRTLHQPSVSLSDQKDVKSSATPKESISHTATPVSMNSSSSCIEEDYIDVVPRNVVARYVTKCGK